MITNTIFKRIAVLFRISAVSIFMIVSGMIVFSPYGQKNDHKYKLIKESVIINASVEKVFQYLGNSNNASDWSVFVDHISTINSEKINDGKLGSIRRCFVHEDESGETWDEETLIVEQNKRRRLNCYNFRNFSLKANNLLTEQIYQPLESGKCKLTFTLFFNPEKASYIDIFKMYYAAFTIADAFQQNLRNIKKINEP